MMLANRFVFRNFCFRIFAIAITLCLPVIVSAATITVNDLNDNATGNDGACTLREAINNANSDSDTTSGDCAAGTGVDTINFSVSGTITCASTLPAITDSDALTIDGAGESIAISGNNSVQVMRVNSGATLNLNSLTIADGHAGFSDGGGILNNGTLNVTNSTFSGNTADTGGAIKSFGVLTVSNSTFSGNFANGSGGAIDSRNPEKILGPTVLTITDSTFSGNSAANIAGAINNDASILSITNSTFSGNSATFFGGGAIVNDTQLSVANSTFSGNTAGGGGGAIWTVGGGENGGTVNITNSTFSGNSATSGGGILNANADAELHLLNTIITNSTSGGDCVNSGTIVTNTNNLIEDGSCGAALSGDPNLDALADNGGPTQTMALQSGSPAIDAGDETTCENDPVNNLDQRGFVRPIDGDATPGAICDIGAYEFGSQGTIEAAMDIQFCGNPNGFNCKKKGVLPVTIFGTATLNVSQINLSTVQLCLAGDPSSCVNLVDGEFPQDRGNPDTDLGTATCTGGVANLDGLDDINVLFDAREVANLISCDSLSKREASPALIIKGELNDGTAFESSAQNNVGIDELLIQNK